MPSVFGSRRSDATPGYNFSGSRRSGQRSGGKFNTIEDGDRIKLQTDIVLTSSKASEYSKDEGYNRYAPRIS